MCIGIWSLEHPDYALVLCTNRDEYLHRPTRKAYFHSFAPHLEDDPSGPILSGRDIKAGGSWFGINTAGRVALLTNITEPSSPEGYSTSRGSLVSSFLLSRSTHPLQDELGTIVPQDANYAGFNLLLLEPVLIQSTPARIGCIPSTSGGTAGPGTTVPVPASPGAPEKNTLDLPWPPPLSSDPPTDTISAPQIRYNSLFVTNHGGGRPLSSRSLFASEKYCGCMSNSIDGADTDRWPKVIRAAADFELLLQSFTPISDSQTPEATLAEQLFGILAWHPEQSNKSQVDLRKTVQVLPIPAVLDGQNTYYGTRLATVLLVCRDGQVLFIERDMWEIGPDGLPFRADPPKERTFHFKINLDNLSKV